MAKLLRCQVCMLPVHPADAYSAYYGAHWKRWSRSAVHQTCERDRRLHTVYCGYTVMWVMSPTRFTTAQRRRLRGYGVFAVNNRSAVVDSAFTPWNRPPIEKKRRAKKRRDKRRPTKPGGSR